MTEEIAGFLAEPAVAVVGMSRARGFGNSAAAALRRAGIRVFPVNEAADEVHGERCWRSLRDLPEPVGAALLVVPPARGPALLEECAALGIRRVWLQRGAESDAARETARRLGLAGVHGECVIMYARPRGVHRLHRWLHERHAARG